MGGKKERRWRASIMAVAKVKKGETFRDDSRKVEVRISNIEAAKALSDAVRTSLGPRGMDKMVKQADGEVIITNDGATILDKVKVVHPAARLARRPLRSCKKWLLLLTFRTGKRSSEQQLPP